MSRNRQHPDAEEPDWEVLCDCGREFHFRAEPCCWKCKGDRGEG